MAAPTEALPRTNQALDFTGGSLPLHLTKDEDEPQRGSQQVQCHPAPKCEAKVGAQAKDSPLPFWDVPSSTVWLLRGGERAGQMEEDEGTGARGEEQVLETAWTHPSNKRLIRRKLDTRNGKSYGRQPSRNWLNGSSKKACVDLIKTNKLAEA